MRTAERTLIEGPAGRIEILVADPGAGRRGVAIVSHPHSLYGGTMDNKVVQTLAKACQSAGFAAVRFNFRGVGASDGVYDDGRGEREDLLAVEKHARHLYPEGDLVLAGFSFGGFVAAAAAESLKPSKLVLVAPAVGRFPLGAVAPGVLVVHGEEDDVVLLGDLLDWARPQRLPVVVFPGTGHFFHGMLAPLQNIVSAYLCR